MLWNSKWLIEFAGSVLYEAMGDLIYPIGRVKNDVKYSDMYTYLSCLQVNTIHQYIMFITNY